MDLKDRLQSNLGNNYSVDRELGGGGMSRVFLAHETALGRNVVVKVLSGEMIGELSAERFAREVRLAASLQHPNIVPVLTTGFADGIPWYSMPYVRGESLRARMRELGTIPRRQVISILRDLARALQYAHEEGVVHRDIKPENILLSGDAAVVTDFGIAKAISVARTTDSGENPATTLTQAGATIGTPSYMAPEQVAGDPIDRRTDIYAWGLIAYELLASSHPFSDKANAQQIMSAHLAEIPKPLSEVASNIPPDLADLVMQCLEKDPDKRPQSAAEILDRLDSVQVSRDTATITSPTKKRRKSFRGLPAAIALVVAIGAAAYYFSRPRSVASNDISSVAVLPFAHERADSTEEYFGEGIADELMTALGKVPGLRVASRTSAIALGKRNDLDVREIADRLGVSTVVEGTVRRSGNRLRVTAQLTNARDGLTMWSEAYDRESKDVFDVQNDITRAIVAALRPGHALSTEKTGPGTTDPDAYDLYMRGQYLVERRGAGVGKAADYFSQAITKDPNFARAYAALSATLELLPYFGGGPADRVEARAQSTAQRALQLDPSLAEPRVALAMAHWHALRWEDADREFKLAIAADSNSAVARTQYGRFLISAARINEAIGQLRIARKLDPLAATSSVWLSYSLAASGDKSKARDESKRSRDLDPELMTNRTVLVIEMVHEGRFKEAIDATGAGPFPVPFNGMVAYNLEKAGDKATAESIRKSLAAAPDTTWMIHTGRTYAYIGSGDTATALSELEAAVANHEITQAFIPLVDHLYDPLRSNPRFAGIVKKLGLDGRGLTKP
jgi:serine/threonine-protein kinase